MDLKRSHINFLLLKNGISQRFDDLSFNEQDKLSNMALDMLSWNQDDFCLEHPKGRVDITVVLNESKVSIRLFVCCYTFGKFLDAKYADKGNINVSYIR